MGVDRLGWGWGRRGERQIGAGGWGERQVGVGVGKERGETEKSACDWGGEKVSGGGREDKGREDGNAEEIQYTKLHSSKLQYTIVYSTSPQCQIKKGVKRWSCDCHVITYLSWSFLASLLAAAASFLASNSSRFKTCKTNCHSTESE